MNRTPVIARMSIQEHCALIAIRLTHSRGSRIQNVICWKVVDWGYELMYFRVFGGWDPFSADIGEKPGFWTKTANAGNLSGCGEEIGPVFMELGTGIEVSDAIDHISEKKFWKYASLEFRILELENSKSRQTWNFLSEIKTMMSWGDIEHLLVIDLMFHLLYFRLLWVSYVIYRSFPVLELNVPNLNIFEIIFSKMWSMISETSIPVPNFINMSPTASPEAKEVPALTVFVQNPGFSPIPAEKRSQPPKTLKYINLYPQSTTY